MSGRGQAARSMHPCRHAELHYMAWLCGRLRWRGRRTWPSDMLACGAHCTAAWQRVGVLHFFCHDACHGSAYQVCIVLHAAFAPAKELTAFIDTVDAVKSAVS